MYDSSLERRLGWIEMPQENAEEIKNELDDVDKTEGKPQTEREKDRREKFAKLHGE